MAVSSGFKTLKLLTAVVGVIFIAAACKGSTTKSASQSGTTVPPARQTSATSASPLRTTASAAPTSSPTVTLTSEQICQAFTPSKVAGLISYPITKAKPNTTVALNSFGCDYSNDTDGLVMGIEIDNDSTMYEQDKATNSSKDKLEAVQAGQDAYWDPAAPAAEFKVGRQSILVSWGDVASHVDIAAVRRGSIDLGKSVIAKFFPTYAK